MLNHLERHTLLFLTAAGREEAWSLRSSFSEEDRDCWSAYPDIPAIFTGRTDAQGRRIFVPPAHRRRALPHGLPRLGPGRGGCRHPLGGGPDVRRADGSHR